jgi:hypothetical protein
MIQDLHGMTGGRGIAMAGAVVEAEPGAPPSPPAVRVLASGNADGRKIDVVEHDDGSLTIDVEGDGPLPCRWGRNSIEACINAYLRLLRR